MITIRQIKVDESGTPWAKLEFGDKILTAEQQERNRQYKKMMEQNELKEKEKEQ